MSLYPTASEEVQVVIEMEHFCTFVVAPQDGFDCLTADGNRVESKITSKWTAL